MKKRHYFAILSLLFIMVNCIKIEQKPTIYAVGDSTVKNGKGDGFAGLWGWGDFMVQFLDTTKVSLENHALGGTSSRTFQALGLWDSVYAKLKKGDYVLIQFGHNDNGSINDTIRARGTIKGIGNEIEEIDNKITGIHEVVHTYGWYLEKIVKNAKEKGAIPIIISPIPRNKWVDGKVPKNNNSYSLWAQQIAERNQITFVDLNGKMVEKLEYLGEENVTETYFYKRDHTHTSAKGAVMAAKIIVDELNKTTNPIKNNFLEKVNIKLPKKKNIFLIGDSTMANNSNENAVGWGIAFPQFCDTMQVNIINKARGGRSSRTFINEGLWDKAKKEFKQGDFVFIQFGHNDAGNIYKKKFRGSLSGIDDKTQNVQRDTLTEVVHTFGWYLSKMIKETKEAGALPVVLSLTPRNEWPNGIVEQRKNTYVKWTQQVAEKENAIYIDVSNLLAEKYQKLGKEKVKDFFPKDHTHSGLEGATFSAKTIAEYLKKSKEIGLRGVIFLE